MTNQDYDNMDKDELMFIRLQNRLLKWNQLSDAPVGEPLLVMKDDEMVEIMELYEVSKSGHLWRTLDDDNPSHYDQSCLIGWRYIFEK